MDSFYIWGSIPFATILACMVHDGWRELGAVKLCIVIALSILLLPLTIFMYLMMGYISLCYKMARIINNASRDIKK